MATLFAQPSHPAGAFSTAAGWAPDHSRGGGGALGTCSPAAPTSAWTSPYGGSHAATTPPQRARSVRAAAAASAPPAAQGPFQGGLRLETAGAWAAPGTPEAQGPGLAAALARRAEAQAAEAAALAWLRMPPINRPPTEPAFGAGVASDDQFVDMLRENQGGRVVPRVHCFAAFTRHSFASATRGDGLFDLPQL